MAVTPTDNGATLDAFNDALRASPGWQQFMQRNGITPGRPIRLSTQQRQALQRELESAGMTFPRGMEIDPAGNINQDQGVSHYWNNPYIRTALIGGAALATMGAAGYGPLAGALSGGGGGAAAGGAAGAAFDVAPNIATLGTGAGAGLGGAAAAGIGGLSASELARYGIPVAGQLIGGVMQNRAQSEADRIQADYYNRALAAQQEENEYRRRFDEDQRTYTRGQRADYLTRLQPYANAGPQAVSRLSGALGSQPTTARTSQIAGGQQSVRMRDPDGNVSLVPAHHVSWYENRGAQRV